MLTLLPTADTTSGSPLAVYDDGRLIGWVGRKASIVDGKRVMGWSAYTCGYGPRYWLAWRRTRDEAVEAVR